MVNKFILLKESVMIITIDSKYYTTQFKCKKNFFVLIIM